MWRQLCRRGWLGLCGLACAGPADAQARRSCEAASVPIHAIQGSGPTSPLLGQVVATVGIVTALESKPGASGFFLQAEVPGPDPASSDAVFVALRSAHPLPEPGERLRVRGRVRELDGMTELDAIELVEACGYAAIGPTPLLLEPRESNERWESMWVSSGANWTLIDSSSRAGNSDLTMASGGRLYAPGHELGNGELDAARRWIFEVPALSPRVSPASAPSTPTRRGTQADAVEGIVHFAAGVQRLRLTKPLTWSAPTTPTLEATSPGALRVAGFNLDNYFVTLGSRGAQSVLELERQRTKLLAALTALDADVLALTELENQDQSSLVDLLSALNEQLGADKQYTWSENSPPRSSVLRSALAYRPSRVRALSAAEFELADGLVRPALLQELETPAGPLLLIVVHLKSKRCGEGPTVVGPAGCGADTRLAEARQLIALTRGRQLAQPAPVLIIGDFNTDSLEAPLLELKGAGLVDLLDRVPPDERYSYVFDGQASLLDHALGSPELARRLRGAGVWHINADEPEYRSYSLANPPAAYHPDALRSSDHDPIFVELELE
jgi:predicted extracellular nuclease